MKAEGGRRKAKGKTLSRDLTDRRGMTLVELLLVLALLVVISSLATPLLQGSFASVRLRRGTDQVLAAWSGVRAKAIETGQIYQFRFAVQSDAYRVDPWYGSSEAAPTTGNRPANGPLTIDEPLPASDWRYEALLPEKIEFVTGDHLVDDATGQRRVDTLLDGGGQAWSAPLLFFPDGATSSASILLRNELNQYQRATLRAATGVARASGLLSRDEAERRPGR